MFITLCGTSVVLFGFIETKEIQQHGETRICFRAGNHRLLLASPISWTGYTIFLLPIFFSLKKWTVPAIISAAILSIPFAIVLQLFQTSFVNFVIFGWLYGWGILLLLGDVVEKYHDDKKHPDELIHFQQEAVGQIANENVEEGQKGKKVDPRLVGDGLLECSAHQAG